MTVFPPSTPDPLPPDDDTIVAVSSPAGAAARGIVRMSGPKALDVLREVVAPTSETSCEVPRVAHPPSGVQTQPGAAGPHTATSIRPHGTLRVNPLPESNYRCFDVDIALDGTTVPCRVYLMRAPASYTREDIVEVHTFGNPALLRGLLDLLSAHGCRPAGPGEFTRRAFLNGRIDLAQAEAVETLIHARDESEFRAASAALAGRLSRKAAGLREGLADLAADAEASLDFADQDIEIISREEFALRLAPIRDELASLLRSGESGRRPRGAVRAVLFGPPNAGKSSLFNALLRRERAIVSPHPGTTRDTIEATMLLDTIEMVLVDTAGLRPSGDDVESMAVSRSRDSVRQAGIGLCVVDATVPPSEETRRALASAPPGRSMVLLNKTDLGPCEPALRKALPSGVETATVSARTGEGLAGLHDRLKRLIATGRIDRAPSDIMVNARQARLVARALAALDRALEGQDGPEFMDLAADDLRDALGLLGQVTGATEGKAYLVSEDILDRIFANFCVGK